MTTRLGSVVLLVNGISEEGKLIGFGWSGGGVERRVKRHLMFLDLF